MASVELSLGKVGLPLRSFDQLELGKALDLAELTNSALIVAKPDRLPHDVELLSRLQKAVVKNRLRRHALRRWFHDRDHGLVRLMGARTVASDTDDTGSNARAALADVRLATRRQHCLDEV